jgi:hypothetical protein
VSVLDQIGSVAALGGAVALSRLFLDGAEPIAEEPITMQGVDPVTGEVVIPELALQWWPESLQDSLQVGWNTKPIDGGSHPVSYWGSNGPRALTCSVKVTRQLLHQDDFPTFAGPLPSIGDASRALANTALGSQLTVNPRSSRNRRYNADVAAVVAYLRMFTYPSYIQSRSRVTAPPVAVVNFPGMQLNEDGSDALWCVMTQCEVAYMKTFPNGVPRVAEVQLGFTQIPQRPDGIMQVGWEVFATRPGSRGNPLRHSKTRDLRRTRNRNAT